VGADWTGNENIVGYPDGLNNDTYVTKPALELIRHALDHGQVPHFLILDEMNLSHVERYFADLLSAIESGEAIPLYEGNPRKAGDHEVPQRLCLPDNLFIIGTVNVDETTYMFSPKVLDRANVIEFRMEPAELEAFLSAPKAPQLDRLAGQGQGFGSSFVAAAADKSHEVPAAIKALYQQEMLLFFNLLHDHNAEFGYRIGYEAARFLYFYQLLGGYAETDITWFDAAMDAVIIQKLLPKLHGSRTRMEGLLWALAWACGADRVQRDGKDFASQLRVAGVAQDEATYGPEGLWAELQKPGKQPRYPLSYEKVMRMWRKLVREQFVSFAEA
jgi:5-methylcytosine-specific restriction endonuclease McrBC GTP-binding regulatory subunit McrB